MSKRAAPVEAPTLSRHDAKTAQGVSVERVSTDSPFREARKVALSAREAHHANPVTAHLGRHLQRNAEQEEDWDPSAEMNQEAAVEAEIQRRRLAREAALKRAVGDSAPVPILQALQEVETPPRLRSTRQNTAGPEKLDAATPRSGKRAGSP